MTTPDLLHRVARLYGVQFIYRDGLAELRKAPTEAVLLVLQALGAPVHRLEDVHDAYRQSRKAKWQQVIEPVIVVWQNDPMKFKVRLPAELGDTPASYRIVLEDGRALEGEIRADPTSRPVAREVDGMRYVARRFLGPAEIPLGYHRLYLRIGPLEVDSYLFCAPVQAYIDPDLNAKRWGLFCPLYALHSERSWGAGDFSDLERFVQFTAERGGHAVATLPMLANFLDEPFNPSPYAPVSRLFWNEFFLDIERVAELNECAEAKSILSSSFVTELQGLRSAPLVDYRHLMALKRQVLFALAGSLAGQESERKASFERYVASHPVAQDYAAFRAKTECERQSWLRWPPANRDGALRPGDIDDDAKHYHLYVQWLCHEQLATLSEDARARGAALYLDFPLGVNRDGYDVWRRRELFALNMSGGAPPDSLFIKGQNWGFPPLHPEILRQRGYRYYVECLSHHMRSAGMLRIDHVMGLHRAFWVPEGCGATDGAYVRYHAPEFYAILNLESHRHRVPVVGENLGTVPDYVNQAMARHAIRGMYVGQFGVTVDPTFCLDEVPVKVVASLNTHDTATFMGFWQGNDIADRVDLKLLNEAQGDIERRYRAAQREALIAFLREEILLGDDLSEFAILKGWLSYLAQQHEEFLLINLEDLWLESAAQNVPGTWQERPNWQRKARYSLDALERLESVNNFLSAIRDIRERIR